MLLHQGGVFSRFVINILLAIFSKCSFCRQEDDSSERAHLKDNPHTLTIVSYSATSLASQDISDGRVAIPTLAAISHGRQKYATQIDNQEEEVMRAIDR